MKVKVKVKVTRREEITWSSAFIQVPHGHVLRAHPSRTRPLLLVPLSFSRVCRAWQHQVIVTLALQQLTPSHPAATHVLQQSTRQLGAEQNRTLICGTHCSLQQLTHFSTLQQLTHRSSKGLLIMMRMGKPPSKPNEIQ